MEIAKFLRAQNKSKKFGLILWMVIVACAIVLAKAYEK
jgi:hypothetical protein